MSNRVSRRQANRWAQDDQSAYAQEAAYAQPQYAQPQYVQPYAQPQYVPPPPPPAPVAPAGSDMFEKLRQLAELKDQGILTEAEFSAQKAKILAE